MGICRVVTQEPVFFYDRNEAAQWLAREVRGHAGAYPVVLGIPRGGLAVGIELAYQLGGQVDVVMTHKIGHPSNPEVAIGAVSENGQFFVEPSVLSEAGVSEFFQTEKEKRFTLLGRALALYREALPKVRLTGRTVLVTDDGVATGFTMRAALRSARQERPKKLIAAIPVGPLETVRSLAKDADETVVLSAPDSFQGVGQFYAHFEPVEEQALLRELTRRAKSWAA